MKQAIRIEHNDGYGIFVSKDRNSKLRLYCLELICPNALQKHLINFNTPYEDELPFESGLHYCAYKSIDHLQQWIMKEELEIILSNGYRIYILDLADYLEGRDNICYKLSDVMNKKDITELFV